MTNAIKALIAVGAVAATSALTAVAAIAVKKIIVNKTLDQAEELVNENETEEVEISEEEKAEVRESMKAEAEELAENSRLVKGLRIASRITGYAAIIGVLVPLGIKMHELGTAQPVNLNASEVIESVLKETSDEKKFELVWNVLRALADHCAEDGGPIEVMNPFTNEAFTAMVSELHIEGVC